MHFCSKMHDVHFVSWTWNEGSKETFWIISVFQVGCHHPKMFYFIIKYEIYLLCQGWQDQLKENDFSQLSESLKKNDTRNLRLLFSICCQQMNTMGFPDDSVGKEPTCNAEGTADAGSNPGSGRSLGGGKWQSTPVFLTGKSHGQRSLAAYSP